MARLESPEVTGELVAAVCEQSRSTSSVRVRVPRTLVQAVGPPTAAPQPGDSAAPDRRSDGIMID